MPSPAKVNTGRQRNARPERGVALIEAVITQV